MSGKKIAASVTAIVAVGSLGMTGVAAAALASTSTSADSNTDSSADAGGGTSVSPVQPGTGGIVSGRSAGS
ncbi:hypothetical protein CVS30_16665 [Arthrobacter psychrolactophilus]|uniref:Uncharacterized protein n=1 Tax=Arthrobacter psychrolactophilus TaxID=92442 RepID=A0A2V5ISU4_9MICC|nr:hypothetical protein CVS30_16665 [Arthrobacter psychrolactophilus]